MSEKRRIVRTAMADDMGFAWEPDELVDMDLADAHEIIRLDDEAIVEGRTGGEDTATVLYARQLISDARRFPS